jgi:hypothetical protein
MTSHFTSFILPHVMMKHIRAAQANDIETVKKRRGCFHAFVMLVCLTVLLSVIYFSQEPYRYMVSSKAFKSGLHMDQLSEGELELSDVWEWFDGLLEDLGGESARSVQLNCAYDDKKSQVVRIDGVDYFLVDPASDESACQQLGYIDGADDRVFLAGAQQVLSFGAFSTRARLQRPLRGAVTSSQRGSLAVAESGASEVTALTDDRVVSLCQLGGRDTDDTDTEAYCVAEDGFSGSTASTFDWIGEYKVWGVMSLKLKAFTIIIFCVGGRGASDSGRNHVRVLRRGEQRHCLPRPLAQLHHRVPVLQP